jgi:hypothetical protein
VVGFAYCWLAGIRYASDSLSQEKREGTLGLLFLTDLRGYDVVLGKLAFIAVRTFQVLMALLPVMSIGLVLGGLTPGEFWRTAAALANTLFFTLSVGLCVSAVSRRSPAALAGTASALLLLTIGPYLATGLASRLHWAELDLLNGISPAAAARAASDLAYGAGPRVFWASLALCQAVAWLALILASVILPRSWQEHHGRAPRQTPDAPTPAPKASRSAREAAFRRQLLDINPIYWLSARNRRERTWSWVFLAMILSGAASQFLVTWLTGGHSLGLPVVLAFSLGFLIKLWVAWHSAATLAEARHAGAMELILATPLRVDEILRGQWQALRRVFIWPVIAMLLLLIAPLTEPLLRAGGAPGGTWFLSPAVALFQMVSFVADVTAVAMVGMWMGLSRRGPVRAFAGTVLYTMVVPTIFFCCPNIVFDVFWIAWAHYHLESQFRRTAAELYTPTPQEWPVSPPPIVAAS